MRAPIWIIVLALAAVPARGGAAPSAGVADAEELDFFCGTYEMIGRQPAGGALYAGTVELSRDGDHLRLRRTLRPAAAGEVAGPDVRGEGTARLERRTADRIRVLTAEIREAGEVREAWCSIGTGLDNDPRLMCEVRVRGTAPAAPGREAWFFRPPAS